MSSSSSTSQSYDQITKNQIIDYVYRMVDVGNQCFKQMKEVADIQTVKERKYYLSANCVGIGQLLVFKTVNGQNICCRIDRRTLSRKGRRFVVMCDVKFTPVNVDAKRCADLFSGTIFDGVALDNGTLQLGDTITFLISDVFAIYGNDVIRNVNYKQKMRMVETIVGSMGCSITNGLELIVSKTFELNQMKELFANYIRTFHAKLNIKGISLYPEFSGEKLIYVFDREDDNTKMAIVGYSAKSATEAVRTNAVAKTSANTTGEEVDNEHLTRHIYTLADAEITEKIILCFEMHKTNKPDVYNIYALKNGNKTFIDIAYIDTYRLSIECKNIFKNKEIANVLCSYNSFRKKWLVESEGIGRKVDAIDTDKRLKLQAVTTTQTQ
jgi:hypothetical protein